MSESINSLNLQNTQSLMRIETNSKSSKEKPVSNPMSVEKLEETTELKNIHKIMDDLIHGSDIREDVIQKITDQINQEPREIVRNLILEFMQENERTKEIKKEIINDFSKPLSENELDALGKKLLSIIE